MDWYPMDNFVRNGEKKTNLAIVLRIYSLHLTTK